MVGNRCYGFGTSYSIQARSFSRESSLNLCQDSGSPSPLGSVLVDVYVVCVCIRAVDLVFLSLESFVHLTCSTGSIQFKKEGACNVISGK